MKKFIAFLLTFMLAFAFIGCGGTKDVNPENLTINCSDTELTVGDSVTLTLTFSPADVTDKTVEWKSSDTSVITVAATSSKVTVTAVGAGTATITATSKVVTSVKAVLEFTVEAAEEILPTAMEISAPAKLAVEGTAQLTVTFTPSNTNKTDVTWASSDAAIATVSESGLVTGVAEGEVTITATSKSVDTVTATATITVGGTNVVATALELSGTAECYTNFVQTLKATFEPSDASTKALTWSSSNEAIAIVNENGKVTPVAAGTVTISATTTDGSNITATFTITIEGMVAPETFTASANIPTEGLKIGYSSQVNINVTPANGDPKATYASSNDAVATVNESGLITGVAVGTCTVTATSVLSPSLSSTVSVTVYDKEQTNPTSITITGANNCYVGYSVKLEATVLPTTAFQSVTWTSNNESVATVDATGKVTGLTEGTARIRAISTVDSNVKSDYFVVKVTTYVEPVAVDLKGYEVVIMNASSALTDNDPFLDGYSGADKTYKQKSWREVEEKYNCKITVTAYPDTAPWGATRIAWIIDNATNNTSQCDLGIVSSNWIYQFAQANAAVDVTSYYGKYGASQMEPALKEAGSYGGGLYIASTGLSSTATYVDLGLFYNQAWVDRLGVDDPATMFNDGKWTYSGFETWVQTVQAALGEGEYAIGGHPYYYWFGMSNAAGQKIADTTTVSVNISTDKSKNASSLIWKLYQDGCVDPAISWAESDGGFVAGTTVMTSGYLWFVRNDNRWSSTMFGEDTRYGYVPFPYPDDMSKEQTRISQSGLSVYMYVAGRSYPAGVTSEFVYQAINAMFLNTITYQEQDASFDANEIKKNSLLKRIDNEESIEAILYYDAAKVFFDPAHGIYSSTSASDLKAPAVYVMYQGADYDESFNAVYDTFYTKFIAIYGASA